MYIDKYEEEQGEEIFEKLLSGENENELCDEYGIGTEDLEEIIRIEKAKRR